MSEPTITTGKLSQFRPTPKNSNKHTVKGLAALDHSLEDNGYVAPMTATADGEVLDGNARLERSFEKFGDEAIIVHHTGDKPIVMVRDDIADASDPRARQIHYRANTVQWQDFALDSAVVMADIEAGFDFATIDVTLPDLGLLLERDVAELLGGDTGNDTEAQVTEVEAEKYHKKWGAKLGDRWQLGEHIIACLDSLQEDNIKSVVGDMVVSAIWADPPYGMNLDTDYSYLSGKGKNMPESKKWTGGNKYPNVTGDNTDFDPSIILTTFDYVKEVFLWGADYYAEKIPCRNNGGWFVWDKRIEETLDNAIGSTFELCWSKQKHKRLMARVKWSGYWGIEREPGNKRLHPTQKPVILFEWFAAKYFKDNWIIFDPFLGSGQSIIGAERLGRGLKVIGFELEPVYISTVIERWVQLTGIQPTLLTEG